ncbi:hypothetical protein GU926_01970 [Nibribacter ruber]|uniref:Uncharacterized protein n=1 Tax=Nibribacter ruber TaxID=2698458 RepID=A0A6P1NR16_9BACT|nr:hypothetical protein [Nibribacter ruber]QHL86276.1 hypothetical protein GU926_01970 [Nibribacter ruber]
MKFIKGLDIDRSLIIQNELEEVEFFQEKRRIAISEWANIDLPTQEYRIYGCFSDKKDFKSLHSTPSMLCANIGCVISSLEDELDGLGFKKSNKAYYDLHQQISIT